MSNELNLSEVSINELFNGDKCTYQVPIYQRNYAWEKDEIEALVNDVFDAYEKNRKNSEISKVYYIGTLVSYSREDDIFEVIDGQQRLTTLRILLSVMEQPIKNKLTYRARKRSDKTLENLENLKELEKIEEKDNGILNALKYAKEALKDIKSNKSFFSQFKKYFLENVHIIHYIVPRDIDLNHYFEVMNSRGEQLEKHEIIKSRLMEILGDGKEGYIFNKIWKACSQMSVYIQDALDFTFNGKDAKTEIFSNDLNDFKVDKFDSFLKYADEKQEGDKKPINEILDEITSDIPKDKEIPDNFQSIIDFPNFLLIVLKITRMSDSNFDSKDFILDDKELINQFDDVKTCGKLDSDFVKIFAYNLLKSKFFLDNYIVHHAVEEETVNSNPWLLQTYTEDEKRKNHYHLNNLCTQKNVSDDLKKENDYRQDNLVQLLSMFEVSFTAKQRKNYLFYCLYYLMSSNFKNTNQYEFFVENLADRYFYFVYLDRDNNLLNEINTPQPGSFDKMILNGNQFNKSELPKKTAEDFIANFGDGTEISKGIPLFVFNYLDYKIWKKYANSLRGEKLKERSPERKDFYNNILGCSDFGLDVFTKFYFSRTRRSLEHYYPQANIEKLQVLTESQINCFGNYAMIGAQANSSGSNWSPKTKLEHYLDNSRKISQISVASLKFAIMMQKCKDNENDRSLGDEWNFEDIKEHQDKMLNILFAN